MQVKSIAECSLGAFCNTFDLHYAMSFFLSGLLRQVLLLQLSLIMAGFQVLFNKKSREKVGIKILKK